MNKFKIKTYTYYYGQSVRNKGDDFMNFFKNHKMFTFAIISFIALSGIDIYMIFELIKITGNLIK